MPKINLVGYKVNVPGNPILRILLGILFILGGVFSFLPVLGVWMLPVGLAILAIDFPPVRRFHRRVTIKLGNWLHRRWPWLARRFGYGVPREHRKS